MKISPSNDAPVDARADVLAIGVRPPKPTQDRNLVQLDRAMNGTLIPYLKQDDFKAKRGETLRVAAHGRVKAKRLLVVGLGKGEAKESDARLLGVHAARAAKNHSTLAVLAPAEDRGLLRALADGITAGAYRYTRYLTGSRKPKRKLQRAAVLVQSRPDASSRQALQDGVALGEAVNLVRDLVNCPANDLSPAKLAELAEQQCNAVGAKCQVYDKKAIEKLGMPLFMAVNQGSSREPRFVHMTFKPRGLTKKTPKVVFVGKGITFDAGGLCLKPPGSMADMKSDMAGAAVTIGILIAAAKLGLPVELHAIIAATDNMLGPDAYRPGDVFPSRDGKTVEIINTDAEGRLVLADALSYASQMKPDYLIDHATLTGACVVALGNYTCGVFSNDEALSSRYRQAAAATGESYWPMPLDSELKDQLRSPIADLKHTGSRMGGAVTAALFLGEFVGKARWVHLDIAGPAYLEKQHGVLPKGGTGFGVLTAVRFLESL